MGLYMMRPILQANGLRTMLRTTGLWGTPFTMAELGSFAGEGVSIFLEAGAECIYAVDLWQQLTYREGIPANARPDWAEAEFDRRLVEWQGAGREVVKIKKDTVEAAVNVADASLDLVYVDAEHSFHAVVADIAAWLPKLKPGGWMAGHDWSWVEVCRGVTAALGHLGPPYTFPDDSWLYRIENGTDP